MKQQTQKRILSLALAFALCLTMLPVYVFAQSEGCTHAHDGGCGYLETAPCGHEHDDDCRYTDAIPETSCNMDCQNGDHDPDCAYTPDVDGTDCTHAHSGDCGYIEAAPCGHEHDADCGGLSLGDSGNPPPASVVIMGFAQLDTDIWFQEVESGAKLDTMTFPDTLAATTAGGDITIIGVTWACPGYDDEIGMTEMEYEFTAVLPQGYTLGDKVTLPGIFALVEGGGIIQPFSTASGLAAQINSFDHGGVGTLTATQSGNIVTVTGAVAGATRHLSLYIDPGVTVMWSANYTEQGDYNSTLSLSGGGRFKIVSGSIIRDAPSFSAILASNVILEISGGLVSANSGSATVCADFNSVVTVLGGTVSHTGTGSAIYASDGATVAVIGGSVSARTADDEAFYVWGGAIGYISSAKTQGKDVIELGREGVIARVTASAPLPLGHIGSSTGIMLENGTPAATAKWVNNGDRADIEVTLSDGNVLTIPMGLAISGLTPMIGEQYIHIEPPVAGKTPLTTTAPDTGYTGAITWSAGGVPHTGAFSGSTAYKATVTLTAQAGYQWPPSPPASFIKVIGQTVTNIQVSGSDLTFDVTFPATAVYLGAFDIPLNGPPESGNMALTAANDTGYAATLTWTNVTDGGAHAGRFAVGKVYKASATLTSRDGCAWPDPAPALTLAAYPAQNMVVAGYGVGNTLTFDVTFPAAASNLGAQTVSITAPTNGRTPQATIADGTNYLGTGIVWYNGASPHSGSFGPSTVYTAKVTLLSTNNYKWPATPPVITVTGGTVRNRVVTGGESGNTLTFDVTFPQTSSASTGLLVNGSPTAYTTVATAQAAIQSAIDSNSAVIVTGALTSGIDASMDLTIPAGKTVYWQAEYSGVASTGWSLLIVRGDGTFVVDNGGEINETAGGTSTVYLADNATVIVSGGTVSSVSGSGIDLFGASSSAVIRAGAVTTSANSRSAILTRGANAHVLVEGGEVKNTNNTPINKAITVYGTGTAAITGGTVGWPSTHATAVYIAGAGTLYFGGGTVAATNAFDGSAAAKGLYIGATNSGKFSPVDFNATNNNLFALDVVTLSDVYNDATPVTGSITATLENAARFTVTGITASGAGGTANVGAGTFTVDQTVNNPSVTITVTGTLAGGKIPISFTTPAFGINVQGAVKTASVGTQTGVLMAGTGGSATFPVTTANIADGTYPVTLTGAPTGVTAENNVVSIAGGSGTLKLFTTDTTPGGTYNLTIAIDGIDSGSFSLMVGTQAKTVAVGSQSGTLTSGVAGSVSYSITTTNIVNGYYSVMLTGAPMGVTAGQVYIDDNKGVLIVNTGISTPAGTTSTLTMTIDGTTSGNFSLTVGAASSTPQTIDTATYSTGPYIVGNQIIATKGTYTANDGGAEGTHTYKWYRANDSAGTGAAEISGATVLTYTPVAADFGKYICIETTPVGDGTLTGTPVKSAYIQVGVKLTATATGAGGASAITVNGIAGSTGTVVYNTTAVSIIVTRNTGTDTVVWTASGSVGAFGGTTAASTTYTPPAAPTGDISLTATLTAAIAKSVSVGPQTGTLTAGAAGSATFTVTTANIASGTAITLNNTNSVSGISLSTSVSTNDSTAVTITTTGATPQGSHPLTLTIDGVTSPSFNLYVAPVGAIPVSGITVSGTGGATTITTNGGTLQMLADVQPTTATNQAVTWSEINGTGSATISPSGLLTATGNGTVTVRATANDGSGEYGEIIVTISGQSVSHTHNYGSAWTSDASNHWHECSCGDKSAIGAHTENSGVVTTPPTSTTTGTRTYSCTVCARQLRTEVIAATGNSGSGNGGSGGSSGGGSSSSGAANWTVTVDKQPNMPTAATIETTGTVDKSGSLSFTITDAMAKDGIEKAEAEAKHLGKIADGIQIVFKITNTSGVKGFITTIESAALDRLANVGTGFSVNTAVFRFSLDAKAVRELDKQTSGKVTFAASPVTKLSTSAKSAIGGRPVFDFTVKDSNGKLVTGYGSGTIIRGIKYAAGSGEKSGSLFIVRIVDGKVQWVDKSSYDNGWMNWSGNSNSVYGVGYKMPAPNFTDTQKHWAKDNIDFVVSRGLISGATSTTFSPDTAITRADFLMALGKLSGADVSGYKQSSFTDVKATEPAMPYIEWAVQNKIVSGIGNNQFGPERLITREQMAVMMVNYAKAPGYTLPVSRQAINFADDAKISTWAVDAVKAIQQTGVINGKDNNIFDPQGSATKAEAATILRRFVELVIDEGTARGWSQNDAGQLQYINEYGKTVKGWLPLTSGEKFYFDTNGVMAFGKWLQIDGKWYYFYPDGKLATDTTIDGYKVGPDGARQ